MTRHAGHEVVNHPRSADLDPTDPEVARRNLMWMFQAMEMSHNMLMAGLRHRIGPDGDIHEAYRQWDRDRQRRKDAERMEVQGKRAESRAENATKDSPERSWSWGAGELGSWGAGELGSWGAGELGSCYQVV